jgi:hypothetical protein
VGCGRGVGVGVRVAVGPGSVAPGSPATSGPLPPRVVPAVGLGIAPVSPGDRDGRSPGSSEDSLGPGVPTTPATSPAGGAGRPIRPPRAMTPIANADAAATAAATRLVRRGLAATASDPEAAAAASDPETAAAAAGRGAAAPPRGGAAGGVRLVSGIERRTDIAAMAIPQAGHDPADRAQHRGQAKIPHARQVRRPPRSREPSGRAGLPQRSQKRWFAPSARSAGQGPIIGRTRSGRSIGRARHRGGRVPGGARHASPVATARCCRAPPNRTASGAAARPPATG